MLKGKLKEEFEQWYRNNIDFLHITLNDRRFELYFYDIPLEMQKGVYEAFFDSKGFSIDIIHFEMRCFVYNITWVSKGYYELLEETDFKTRQEAFEEAINKLNEILG